MTKNIWKKLQAGRVRKLTISDMSVLNSFLNTKLRKGVRLMSKVSGLEWHFQTLALVDLNRKEFIKVSFLLFFLYNSTEQSSSFSLDSALENNVMTWNPLLVEFVDECKRVRIVEPTNRSSSAAKETDKIAYIDRYKSLLIIFQAKRREKGPLRCTNSNEKDTNFEALSLREKRMNYNGSNRNSKAWNNITHRWDIK